MADCLGSLLVYDILTTTIRTNFSSSSSLASSSHFSPSISPKNSEHLPPGASNLTATSAPPSSSPLHYQRRPKPPQISPSVRSGSSDEVIRRSPLLLSERVEDGDDEDRHHTAFFSFYVAQVFVFGSPLGLVLAARKNRKGKVAKPFCGAFYNLFYAIDPLANRLEPLIDSHFSTLSPVSVPLYHRYPTGENVMETGREGEREREK